MGCRGRPQQSRNPVWNSPVLRGLFAVVDAHDTAQQVEHANACAPKLLHKRSDAILGGVFFEEFENVTVSGAIPAEDPPKNWHRESEVSEVPSAQPTRGRFAKVQDKQARAGAGDAMHFGKSRF